jgi:hypothetical protein
MSERSALRSPHLPGPPLPKGEEGEQQPGDDFLRWSADGRALFLWRRDAGAPARVFRLDLSTGRKEPWLELRPPDPAGIYSFTSLVVTPEGKSYAYTYGRVLTDLHLAEGLR